ncbi:Oligosaccharyl transferase STT3 subunit [Methanocaldococcus sp. FS406-22]|uniref:STT3 domain-containing protein n=1 Tax=Methanocaldococcus sp. (strain FS406-22) TaxID=644281 RepID=UPI0001BF47EA|nr:STT3 domain-containing protein [Methanocaldococcus sp. FS406-22]ADC69229.1 Oligosaccharyl transferase STT3 subunit [Methanocaldococcus sp. FS406-22]
MSNALEKISNFFKERNWIKILLIVLMLMFMSFQLRAQTADMKFAQNNEFLKKMFSDEHGRMYLLAIDPYYYLRLSENLYDHGYCGDTIKIINGKEVPYDLYQYAPPGHPIPWEPPVICLATLAIYYIWHSIDATVIIMNAAFWVPAVLGMLLGIPIYFIVRRVTNSNIGGIVGAIAIISAPALLYKTCAGFADTPIFEILPILFIVWFILEAIHSQEKTALFKKDLKNPISLFVIAALIIELIFGIYLNIASGESIVIASVFFYAISLAFVLAGLVIAGIKKLKGKDVEFELFALLAVILTAVAPKMWGAWWYGFDVITGFLITYIIALALLKSQVKIKEFIDIGNFKNVVCLSIFYILGSIILLTAIYGVGTAISPITSPLGYNKILSSYTLTTGWPNVYTTVAELAKPSSWGDIFTNAIGSNTIAIVGILGIVLSFLSLRHEKIKFDIKYAILLAIWLVVTLYAATKGIRFASLATPPLAIGLGIFVGQLDRVLKMKNDTAIVGIGIPAGLFGLLMLSKYSAKISQILLPTTYVPAIAYGFLIVLALLAIYKISDIISTINDKKETIIKISALLLCIGVIIPPLSAVVPFSAAPTFNNGWKAGLDWIKETAPKNAVITCWWDNGHIYTYEARRMVTFDGGSQNTPRAYWVGRIFATSNENLAIGIIRMLATSGDEAFEKGSVLMNFTHNNVSETVKILNEILPVNRSTAYEILTKKYGLSDKEAELVLNATHPEHPNPDYLITYNRMTDIAPVWSMFGFWNFSLPPNTPDKKREKGAFFKGTSYYLGNGTILTNVNVYGYSYVTLINNTNISTYIVQKINGQTKIIGTFKIHKLYIKTPSGVREIVLNKDGQLSEFIRLNANGEGYAWLSTRNLEDSIYARLHFLDGYGLKHIKLVKATIDPTDFGVQPGFKIYKVDYGTDYLK